MSFAWSDDEQMTKDIELYVYYLFIIWTDEWHLVYDVYRTLRLKKLEWYWITFAAMILLVRWFVDDLIWFIHG